MIRCACFYENYKIVYSKDCPVKEHREMKTCKECGKIIKGEFATCKSLEPEDYGKQFYLHKDCLEKNYRKGEGPN